MSTKKELPQNLHSATVPSFSINELIFVDGAGGRIRTPDLLITNQLLYRLSYTSIYANKTAKSIPTTDELFYHKLLYQTICFFLFASLC